MDPFAVAVLGWLSVPVGLRWAFVVGVAAYAILAGIDRGTRA